MYLECIYHLSDREQVSSFNIVSILIFITCEKVSTQQHLTPTWQCQIYRRDAWECF